VGDVDGLACDLAAAFNELLAAGGEWAREVASRAAALTTAP
jgi:hypothetical protein